MKLASELTGIKSMTAEDSRNQQFFVKLQSIAFRYIFENTSISDNAKELGFKLRHDTKGFTSTVLSQKNLFGKKESELAVCYFPIGFPNLHTNTFR